MYNFDKKQKIALVILIFIVVGGIFYYVYGRGDNSIELESDDSIIAESKEEEQKEKQEEEQYSDSIILVHMSGAVNKEGVIELKVNSRISDAIEKARWDKR